MKPNNDTPSTPAAPVPRWAPARGLSAGALAALAFVGGAVGSTIRTDVVPALRAWWDRLPGVVLMNPHEPIVWPEAYTVPHSTGAGPLLTVQPGEPMEVTATAGKDAFVIDTPGGTAFRIHRNGDVEIPGDLTVHGAVRYVRDIPAVAP